MFFYKVKFHLLSAFLKFFYNTHRNIKIGKKTNWRKSFSLICEKNGFIFIGNSTFFNNNCTIVSKRKVYIGDKCLFGENVKIYDHNHKFNIKNIPIKDQGYTSSEIFIGNNCWIGNNVLILKGARIGNNCVIGAGLIIDFQVKDNSIVKRSGTNYVIEEIKYAEN